MDWGEIATHDVGKYDTIDTKTRRQINAEEKKKKMGRRSRRRSVAGALSSGQAAFS